MIDSFPYDAWDQLPTEGSSPFWTYGPGPEHDLLGTFVLTGIGMAVMVLALIGWVWLEHQKLMRQTRHLRGAMAEAQTPPAAGRSGELGS